MTVFEKARSAVEQRLGACNAEFEAWKIDHEKAMLLFDCEELLESMVELFDDIDNLNRQYSDDVLSGVTSYDEEFDDRIKTLCIGWLNLAEEIRDGTLAWCKAQYDVSGEEAFLKKLATALESKQHGFDTYAIEKANVFRAVIGTLNPIQTPIASWPD